MKVRKTVGNAIIAFGCLIMLFSFLLKCHMFGFSSQDGRESISIYAYTLNEEKTEKAFEELFSDGVYVIEKEKALSLKPSDINAVYTRVYLSDSYVENGSRAFLDRFYSIFLLAMGAIVVIAGISLRAEKEED